MASVLAIVSKAIFEQDRDMFCGELFETSEYVSKHKALESLVDGGSLFLVTVRPPDEKLWLIGILEQPVFVGDRWTARVNVVPITDITEISGRLVFETGTGIK